MNNNFTIELLFETLPKRPTANMIFRVAKEYLGDIDILNREEDNTVFAVKNYTSYVKNDAGESAIQPVQLSIGKISSFDDKKSVSEFARTQIWNISNPDEILNRCKYSLKISDLNAQGQIPKERAEMLVYWLEASLKLFPDCIAIWIPNSGKLQLTDSIKHFKQKGITKFIYSALNVRFFNVPHSNEFIVDSLGLSSIGLSDVQFHFKGLNPKKIADLTYRLAWYVLNTSADEAPIRDGDTIDGLDEDGSLNPLVQWTCRYEDSIVEPLRPVLDIQAGKYAVGERE